MFLPSTNLQTFPFDHPPVHPPSHLDTSGENNTPITLTGCGIKTVQELGFETEHGLLPFDCHKVIFHIVDIY